MSGLDDLKKGMDLFRDEVNRFVTTSALGNARKQLNNLSNQQLKEDELMQAQQQVSDNLAMTLAGADVPATTIQQTAGRFGITAERRSVNQEAMKRQDDQQAFQGGENAKNRQLQRDLAKTTLEAQFGKAGKRLSAQTASRLERGRKNFLRVGKKALEAVNQSHTALSLLSSGNPVADQAIKTFMARATGEVGNLTEAEREMFAGSPQLHRQAKRIWDRYLRTGKLAPGDRKDLIHLATTMRNSNRTALRRVKDNEMKSIKAIVRVAGDDVSDEVLGDAIFSEAEEITNNLPDGGSSKISISAPAGDDAWKAFFK